MDLEFIKDAAEAIKDIMISLGLIAGGMWAILQFLTLRHDQRVKEQSVLSMELDVQEASIPGREDFFLNIVIRVRNQGSRNSDLQFGLDNHLTVTPLEVLPDGTLQHGQPVERFLKRDKIRVETTPVLSGSSVELPFFVAVPGPGLYVVRFYVKPNEEQRQVILRAGGVRETDSIVMSAVEYVIVGLGVHDKSGVSQPFTGDLKSG